MTRGALGFALLGAVGACESAPPIDAKQTTTTAALNASDAVARAGKALGFALSEDGTLQKTASAATTSTGDVTSPMMSAGMPTMPTPVLRAMVGPALTAQVTGTVMPSMMTTEEQFDQAASELRRTMQERLFVDSNLEGTAGDTATYWLKPDPTCRPLPQDTDPAGTVPDVDAKCADELTKVQVRVTVKSDGDGAALRVLIGPSRLELVAFVVHSDLLSAEVDLPSAKAASDYINQQLGQDSPSESYERLTGRLKFSLKKAGDQAVTASMAITGALDLAQTGGSEITSAVADPLFAVTGDGVSKTATIQVGLGATEFAGPWDPQHQGVKNRDQRISIGGIYGKIALDENAKKIVLDDVGIGSTKITVRGTTVFDLNLNADSMRRFSGVATVNADDSAHFELTPKADLTLAFDYQSVAADFSTPPASSTLHDTYEVALTNAAGGACALDTVKATAVFTGGVRVSAGTLALSATSAPDEAISVPTGKCLSSPGPAPTGKNPLLGALLVSDCP